MKGIWADRFDKPWVIDIMSILLYVIVLLLLSVHTQISVHSYKDLISCVFISEVFLVRVSIAVIKIHD